MLKTIDKETNIYYTILKRQDITKFTYEDYLKCLEERKKKLYFKVEEEQAEYEIINSTNVHHPHDKTYRKLLSNKKDASYIINEALNLKGTINPEEIESYNSSFVTNKFINREADIVYKLKNNNTYFLIEHQSKLDYRMVYRIQEYKLEIIKSAIDKNKITTKDYQMPYVVPIVIYTGKEKWNVSLYLDKIQDERLESLGELKYNVIDINKIKEEDLLKSDHLIDKIFLLEKMKKTEELTKTIEKVISQLKIKEEKEMFIQIITLTLEEEIGSKKLEEIVNKIRKEENYMLENVVEMLREDKEKAKREGKREGMNKILTNMLRKGITIEEIKEMTGLSKKEIEQAKLNS